MQQRISSHPDRSKGRPSGRRYPRRRRRATVRREIRSRLVRPHEEVLGREKVKSVLEMAHRPMLVREAFKTGHEIAPRDGLAPGVRRFVRMLHRARRASRRLSGPASHEHLHVASSGAHWSVGAPASRPSLIMSKLSSGIPSSVLAATVPPMAAVAGIAGILGVVHVSPAAQPPVAPHASSAPPPPPLIFVAASEGPATPAPAPQAPGEGVSSYQPMTVDPQPPVADSESAGPQTTTCGTTSSPGNNESGMISGAVRALADSTLRGIAPTVGAVVHQINCGLVVPIEQAVGLGLRSPRG